MVPGRSWGILEGSRGDLGGVGAGPGAILEGVRRSLGDLGAITPSVGPSGNPMPRHMLAGIGFGAPKKGRRQKPHGGTAACAGPLGS